MKAFHSVSTLAPHRISLVGGGTDLPSVSNDLGGGCISFTIPKYIYVTCKLHSPDQFHERYRLQYSHTEVVNSREDIQNNIIRESLTYLNLDIPLVISVTSDLPSGSGLGSSSSFTVALLLALKTLLGIQTNPFEIAEEAYQIERKINGDSVGRQDQYAAAIGGFNYYSFAKDGSVSIKPILNSQEQLSNLSRSSLLAWTGISRSASTILEDQSRLCAEKRVEYRKMNSLTNEFYSIVKSNICTEDHFSEYLRKNWEIKKFLSNAITTPEIDSIFEMLNNKGAKACKLLGAGGGGYILVVGVNDEIRDYLKEIRLHTEPVGYNLGGARVLYRLEV